MAAVCTLMEGSGFQDFESINSTFTQRQLAAMGVQSGKDGVQHSPSDTTFGRVLANCEVRELVASIAQ